MSDEHIRDLTRLTRRDLFTLACVSSSLLTNMRRGWPSAGILEEFLSEVTASVTTCWYLLQRSDGLPTVEWAVPQYLPEVVEVVKHLPRSRQRAAYLAAQGFLLRGLVAHHRTRFAERVEHCQEAVTYAGVSGDLTLLVESLRALGGALLFNKQPEESLKTYLQAEAYSKSTQLPGFLRSKILGELSHPYAKQGNDQEVVRCLNEAHDTFTRTDSETPVFLLADHGRHQTILYEGLSTLDLGNHAKGQRRLSLAREYWKDAADKFGKMEKLPSGVAVPVRIAAEVLIAQALAYAKARNMEGFLSVFEKGVQLAKELGSKKRLQEAREALNAALEEWPNDQRITGLWELLV
jgi:tetratricopeptide (TPR) repeat protein